MESIAVFLGVLGCVLNLCFSRSCVAVAISARAPLLPRGYCVCVCDVLVLVAVPNSYGCYLRIQRMATLFRVALHTPALSASRSRIAKGTNGVA